MKENFTSIPGLQLWIDAEKSPKYFFSNLPDEIRLFQDISQNLYTFNAIGGVNGFKLVDGWFDTTAYGGIGYSYDISQYPTTIFEFLHDGSPYLFYAICKSFSPVAAGVRYSPNTTAQSTLLGVETLITTHATDVGKFNYHTRVHVDGTAESRPINISLTNITNAKINNGAPFIIKHVNYGYGTSYGIHQMNIFFDGIRIGGGNWTAQISGPSHRRFQIGSNGLNEVSMYSAFKVIMVYNMTGFSGTDIDTFDTKIRNLILEEYGI